MVYLCVGVDIVFVDNGIDVLVGKIFFVVEGVFDESLVVLFGIVYVFLWLGCIKR